ASFEEVVYLLLNLELPTQEQLDEIKKELNSNMELPDQVIEHLRSYDLTKVHPMAALRTAISFLGILDEEADVMEPEANRRKAIRLQAQVASIVAAFSRIRKGQDPVKPKKDLTYAENFLYMLNNKEPEPDRKST